MTQTANPYDHLPDYVVKSQIKKLSRHLLKSAMKGKSTENFEQKRTLLLTLSDSLDRRKELEWLEKLGSQELSNVNGSN